MCNEKMFVERSSASNETVKLATYVARRVRQRIERGSVLSEVAYGKRQCVE